MTAYIIPKLTTFGLLFALDIEIITCPLPVSPKFGFQDDMCSIPEETESCLDFLTQPTNECAEQLTVMDAVSFIDIVYVTNSLRLRD